MNVDGSGQHQLTHDPGPDQNPAWSPDGRTIAFKSYRDERPLGGRKWQEMIYVMNADGSGQRKLTRLSNSDGSFSWSPDGRRIAFVSDRDGNDEVYVINVDGSGLRNLTRNPARDGHPKWSSDGRTIGFVSNRGGNRDIYVMNADGSRQRNLTRGIDQQAFGIAWSPARRSRARPSLATVPIRAARHTPNTPAVASASSSGWPSRSGRTRCSLCRGTSARGAWRARSSAGCSRPLLSERASANETSASPPSARPRRVHRYDHHPWRAT